ncbi:hypothetical protein [Saccharothrix deserti]|uniref:hypothetical protein n=1 Tax=Saccharothrix deserti TaxID=2593674 RepID=UPI00131C2E30|nr:hypothetical protein [Saccharothrix deserti]
MTNPMGQKAQPANGFECGPGCCEQPGSSSAPRLELALLPVDEQATTQTNAEPVPIACTLSGSEQGQRIAQWHELLAGAPQEDIAGGRRWRLPKALASEVAELAAAEQACCAFFDFNLRLAAGGMWLDVRAPIEAADLLTDVFGAPARAEDPNHEPTGR